MRFYPLLLLLILTCIACQKKKSEPTSAKAEKTLTQIGYAPGKKVYVHALAGLSLRKAPDAKAEKIGLARYGEALEIVAAADPKHSYVAEIIDDFQLKGHWVKVKNAEQQEAYVFDGYLAAFPPIAEEPEENMALPEWFYLSLSKFKGERVLSPTNEKEGIVEGYKQAYADGAEFELILYNGGLTQYLRIPSTSLSFAQAFVTLRSFYFPKVKNLKMVQDNKSKKIRVSDADSPYEWVEFEEKDGQVVVGFYSAD